MLLQRYYPLASRSGTSGASATVSKGELFKYNPTPGSTVTTLPVTVTPVGMTGPYTYSWTPLGGQITVNSPTAATTTFTYTGVGIASTANQIFVCQVTDSLSATAYASVQVEFQVGGALQ